VGPGIYFLQTVSRDLCPGATDASVQVDYVCTPYVSRTAIPPNHALRHVSGEPADAVYVSSLGDVGVGTLAPKLWPPVPTASRHWRIQRSFPCVSN
jgi:hypothetical protein